MVNTVLTRSAAVLLLERAADTFAFIQASTEGNMLESNPLNSIMIVGRLATRTRQFIQSFRTPQSPMSKCQVRCQSWQLTVSSEMPQAWRAPLGRWHATSHLHFRGCSETTPVGSEFSPDLKLWLVESTAAKGLMRPIARQEHKHVSMKTTTSATIWLKTSVQVLRTCHFCACRARRGNSKCLAKSSSYAGPSASTEVARLHGSGTFGAFWACKYLPWERLPLEWQLHRDSALNTTACARRDSSEKALPST